VRIIYTKHAQEKLKRKDIKKFKINKSFIESSLKNLKDSTRTKYRDYSIITQLDSSHNLRIIYDIIESYLKVITFHVAKKGRYET